MREISMKLAIIGSRNFNDYELLKRWAYVYLTAAWGHNVIIVSGGAKGADSLSEKFAEEYAYKKEIYLPNWEKHGKAAGFIRNQKIIDACDMVLAFWDGQSKGTEDSIKKAKVAKKPTFIVYF